MTPLVLVGVGGGCGVCSCRISGKTVEFFIDVGLHTPT